MRTSKTIKGKRRRHQRGWGVDVQKFLAQFGELHWPGYQYMGPGIKLEKRLKRGDPWREPIGTHCQTIRHRLQSSQEFARQVDGGRQDDQGH